MKHPKNALIFIFITVLIDVIGLGIIIPVTPGLIKELTGEGISEASKYSGWLTFSYAIMQFVCSPVLGALSDRYGRRPILLFALLGLGIDYIFQAMSPTIFWLFLGRTIAGIGGASFSTATAYISDVSEPEKRAQNFGLIGAAFGLGFIIGPLLGGFAGKFWGPRSAFWLAAGFSVLNLIYGYFVLPESLASENVRPFSWKNVNPLKSILNLKKYQMISGLILGEFLIFLAGKSVESNWNFFTEYKFGWDSDMVGISLTVVGLAVALVQGWLIRIVIPKWGEKKSIILGFSFDFVSLFLFGIASQGWMMFAILIPYAMSGIGGAALQGVMANQVGNDEQGELQGTINGINSITYIVGPLIMNNLFYYFTQKSAPILFPGAPFILGSILGLIGLFVCLKAFSNPGIKTDIHKK